MVREILLPAIKVCQMYSNLPSHHPLSPSPQLSSTKMSKIEKLQRRKSIRLKMYSNLLLISQPFPKPTNPLQRNKILKQPILKSTKFSDTHNTKVSRSPCTDRSKSYHPEILQPANMLQISNLSKLFLPKGKQRKCS